MQDKLIELRTLSTKKNVVYKEPFQDGDTGFMPEFNQKVKKAQQLVESIK